MTLLPISTERLGSLALLRVLLLLASYNSHAPAHSGHPSHIRFQAHLIVQSWRTCGPHHGSHTHHGEQAHHGSHAANTAKREVMEKHHDTLHALNDLHLFSWCVVRWKQLLSHLHVRCGGGVGNLGVPYPFMHSQ